MAPGSRMLTVSVVTPVRSDRPVAAWNWAAVIRKFAARDAPLVATSAPGWTFGCDRRIALTRTSAFGIVYDTSPRSDVCHGSAARHAGSPSITATAPTVVVLGAIGRPNRPVSTAHVSLTPRPVLVPPWNVTPFRV